MKQTMGKLVAAIIKKMGHPAGQEQELGRGQEPGPGRSRGVGSARRGDVSQ